MATLANSIPRKQADEIRMASDVFVEVNGVDDTFNVRITKEEAYRLLFEADGQLTVDTLGTDNYLFILPVR